MKPGDRLGHYTIVSHLGSGGMGAVYRARERGRDRPLREDPRFTEIRRSMGLAPL